MLVCGKSKQAASVVPLPRNRLTSTSTRSALSKPAEVEKLVVLLLHTAIDSRYLRKQRRTEGGENLDGGEKKSISYKYIFFWGGRHFFIFSTFAYFLFSKVIIDFN